MFLYVVLSLLIILIINYYLKTRRYVKLGNALPGPSYYPFVGNLDLASLKLEETFKTFKLLREKYGRTYRLWFLNELWIIFSDPKDIEFILTSPKINMTKSSDYALLRKWLGSGLLTSEGSKWFSRRKVITPAFHFNILEDFLDVFDAQTTIFVNKIKSFDEDTFDVTEHVALCSLDIICEAAMGASIKAQENSDSSYCKAVKTLSHIIYQRILSLMGHQDWYYAFKKETKLFNESIKIVHDFTDSIISKRREQLVNGMLANDKTDNDTDVNQFNHGTRKRMALLDILLQAKINDLPLSDEDIREEVLTFGFAGHDTVSSAITFILYNIAKYPDTQDRILEEMISVIGSDITKASTLYNLSELKYLDIVIKESLRLYPPVPLIGRQIIDEIEINGKIIPADSNITIGIYLMNMDADIFPEPEKFIPERFLTETTASEFNPFSYLPFSGGQRNCIGQRFAILEIKSFIVKILHHFQISLPNPTFTPILTSELVLRSMNGMKITFKKRLQYNLNKIV